MIGEIFIRNRSGNFFHYFSSVVGIWNEQQAEVVEAGTIVTLKRHMDRYMESNDFVGYMSQMGMGRARLDGLLGQHRQVGPKGLFPICMTDYNWRKLVGLPLLFTHIPQYRHPSPSCNPAA